MIGQIFNHKNTWFAGLVISILLIFFCFRPLNSSSYRIIVADGLGYYAYLPAKFIYNDTQFEFNWFDNVFNANYEDHLFEKPTQNFMVKYNDRMINLYYPGQSLLQIPFFSLAHVSAKLFNYQQDGFSFPYQLGMGISGIFYTLLGLLFCQKLIYNISKDHKLSVFLTLIIFFATNLFTYSIFAGCYTHCYSFAFITLSLYFSQRFFYAEENKLFHLLMLFLCSVIVVFLRPLNGILLLSVLYFFKSFSPKELLNKKGLNIFPITIAVVLLLIVIIYNAGITYAQTHSVIANTYTIGKFYFNDWSHVRDNFFGFQNGIVWYTPIIFISFISLIFLFRKPKLLFLLVPVLVIILLYSFWFYWNIVNRTLVDFSAIIALLLLQLSDRFKSNRKQYITILVMFFLCVPFFQLKAYQLRNGILNSNYTYWKYYVKYFFTLRHIDVYPVNPKTIKQKQEHFYDFENPAEAGLSQENSFEGKMSAILDSRTEYACSKTYTLPSFFNEPGFKKIKISFWFYRTNAINNIHLVFTLTKNDSTVTYHPFYINNTTQSDRWEFKEFGMDLPEKADRDCKLSVYFWNPDKRNKAFIDNFKLELILKNGSDEITLNK